jgi:hypothetical protein
VPALDSNTAITEKQDIEFLSFIFKHLAIVAERLRRLTRNQLGSPRAGSSPADCESFLGVHQLFFLLLLAHHGIDIHYSTLILSRMRDFRNPCLIKHLSSEVPIPSTFVGQQGKTWVKQTAEHLYPCADRISDLLARD